jgi:hypothetical protein
MDTSRPPRIEAPVVIVRPGSIEGLSGPAAASRIQALEAALRELYETAHDILNAPDPDGRMLAGTPRLNAALGRAFAALHAKPSQ